MCMFRCISSYKKKKGIVEYMYIFNWEVRGQKPRNGTAFLLKTIEGK